MTYPTLRLISHKICPFVQRARIVLAERDIPHELRFIDLANRPDWFLEISPTGKVPVLCVAGKPLFESTAIIEYLNDISGGTLHPDDAYERARNRAWIEIASSTQMTIGSFRAAQDEDAFEVHVATLRRRFKSLEQELAEGPFFNGASFALVDAAFAPAFRYLGVVDHGDSLGLFDNLARVTRWRDALAERPSVQAAVVEDYARRLYAFVTGKASVLGSQLRNNPPPGISMAL
jgi:glutathione S-transferase